MQDSFLDIAQHPELFFECIKIYEDSFPEWERESVENISKNIASRTYKMCAYLHNSQVIGFYILDSNFALDYTLFSFVAIKESQRGMGYGSKLCLHAIEDFHTNIASKHFLIEAEQRQSKLYERLGFKIIDIPYRVPAFDSDKTIFMYLMQLKTEEKIDKVSLKKIIKDIFQRGYSLDKNDARIEEQLSKIK